MRVRVVATLQRGALINSEPLDEQNSAAVLESYWNDMAERRALRRTQMRTTYDYEPNVDRMMRQAARLR